MKRLSAHFMLPLAAALALVLACKEAPEGFIPLETGRKTVYEVEYSDLLGGARYAESVERVEEKVKIGGQEYFRVVMAMKGIPGHATETYYKRLAADGLHELRYVDGQPVDSLSIPWPLKVGKAWLVKEGGAELTCRVEDRAPAVLPEKTYDDAWKISCYGLRAGDRSKSETYLVEGVGEVRIVQELGLLRIEMRLRETG